MPKSDQRTRVTKLLIRKAFMEFLTRKHIQSISIKELCDEAGISRGTFYAHYIDIYDLLEKIENEMLCDFEAALEPLLNAQAGDITPLEITTGIFKCLKENADLCTVTLGTYGDKKFAGRLLSIGREKCMESYRKYFAGASPKQIEYYYAFVSSGCIGLLEKWLGEGMTAGAEEIAQTAEDIMMRGIQFLQN